MPGIEPGQMDLQPGTKLISIFEMLIILNKKKEQWIYNVQKYNNSLIYRPHKFLDLNLSPCSPFKISYSHMM
jgi:hypothetical protein